MKNKIDELDIEKITELVKALGDAPLDYFQIAYNIKKLDRMQDLFNSMGALNSRVDRLENNHIKHFADELGDLRKDVKELKKRL